MNLRPWLILSRGSNLPTVWSSTMAGWLLGAYWSSKANLFQLGVTDGPSTEVAWWPLPWLLLAVSAIYVGGMILNDVFDAAWDAQHRPTRPIPSGQVSAATAYLVGFSLLLAGAVGAVAIRILHARSFPLGSDERNNNYAGEVVLVAGLLVSAVLVYNRWHKGVVWAPVVMGLCRALLPILGLVVAGISLDGLVWPSWTFILLCSFTLWLLTFTLTWVARHEATDSNPPAWTSWVIYLVPYPAVLVLYGLSMGSIFVLPICLLYMAWIWFSDRRHPLPAGVPGRVSDRLAAFPMLDYLLLSSVLSFAYIVYALQSAGELSERHLAAVANWYPILGLAVFGPLVCFGLTLLFRRWIPQT
jgi:4-hydroxybenzoate polyprenyltransferase